MRDFDADRAKRDAVEQGFKVCGEQFGVQTGVHPSVMGDYEDAVLLGRGDMLTAMDTAIKAFLVDDDARKRWDKLRERRDDPLTVGHMRAVLNYLYEVEAELPTSAPTSSSSGRGSIRRTSEAATSQPAGAAT